jgi:hypothetical protein
MANPSLCYLIELKGCEITLKLRQGLNLLLGLQSRILKQ